MPSRKRGAPEKLQRPQLLCTVALVVFFAVDLDAKRPPRAALYQLFCGDALEVVGMNGALIPRLGAGRILLIGVEWLGGTGELNAARRLR